RAQRGPGTGAGGAGRAHRTRGARRSRPRGGRPPRTAGRRGGRGGGGAQRALFQRGRAARSRVGRPECRMILQSTRACRGSETRRSAHGRRKLRPRAVAIRGAAGLHALPRPFRRISLQVTGQSAVITSKFAQNRLNYLGKTDSGIAFAKAWMPKRSVTGDG